MPITSSLDAFLYLQKLMTADVEEFWAMALRSDCSIINAKCLFRGTVDACFTHPRDVFRFACLENGSSLIVAHNHPSQDPRPSKADRVFTKRLLRASRIMEIPLLDHIIVTSGMYWSFADQKLHIISRP